MGKKNSILIVESDPKVAKLLSEQVLSHKKFYSKVVPVVEKALEELRDSPPDIILANLDLVGLSGKDLLVAIPPTQKYIPVIIFANQGGDVDVLKAFRLGATDFIFKPFKDTEVIAVVEKALKSVDERKERERLTLQIKKKNKQLQLKVNELTTIFAVGKAVISITNQDKLSKIIVDGAVKITHANFGWLLVKQPNENEFYLQAEINLPLSLRSNIKKSWDDGVSSLVANSGEPFRLNGKQLNNFKLSHFGKSILIIPAKVKGELIAILVVMRKKDEAFSVADEAMLQAVGDYASISLVNAGLFKIIAERADTLERAVENSSKSERIKDEIIQNASYELRIPLVDAKEKLDEVMKNYSGKELSTLEDIQYKIDQSVKIVKSLTEMTENLVPRDLDNIVVNDLLKQVINRYKAQAKEKKLKISNELPFSDVVAFADPNQIALVLDALLFNAIKYSKIGGEITLRVQITAEGKAHISIADKGIGISKEYLDKIFNRFFQIGTTFSKRSEGIGVGLTMVKEIVESHGGNVWVESVLHMGSTFHFTLLASRIENE